MHSFIKVQVASIAGSLADYLLTMTLVEIFKWGYVPANVAGNICGGSLQFVLCRNWAFQADKNKTQIQVIKFIAVFIGNLILSTAGIYIFTRYLGLHYLISKTITSVMLGISYNYFMQKKFVFN